MQTEVAIKEVGGVFLPAHETHLVEWMKLRNFAIEGKLTYQYHKLQAAMKFVKRWRVAVDVGAHCGLWSMHLAKVFQEVHAFEPVELHRSCFDLNVVDGAVSLHAFALGEKEGTCSIHTSDTSSGDSWVDGEGSIPMRTLDSVLPEIENLDFMKLDCEGFELFALRGAEQAIIRCHPCIIVEQKPGRAQKFGLPETEAVNYLCGLGAKLRQTMSGDYILSWD